MRNFLFVSFVSLQLSLVSQAQTAETSAEASSQIAIPTLQTAAEKKFSLEVDWSTDTNMYQSTESTHRAHTSLSVQPSYRVLPKWTAGAEVGLEQKLYDDRGLDMANTVLSIRRNAIAIDHNHDVTLQASVVAPTSTVDYQDNTFRGAIGASAGVAKKFALLKQPATLSYALSGLKNRHAFETNNERADNISHRIRHTVVYSQALGRRWSIELMGRYQTGWTYQNEMATAFLLSETLTWSLNPQASLYVGHNNQGDALKPNGMDSNVRVYDVSQSTVVAGLTLKY